MVWLAMGRVFPLPCLFTGLWTKIGRSFVFPELMEDFSIKSNLKECGPHQFSLILKVFMATKVGNYKTCDLRQQKSCKYHSSSDSPANTIHAKVIRNGTLQDSNTGNYILSLYVKSEYLDHAKKLFDEFLVRDVQTWTILMSGLARKGCSEMALKLFGEMQIEGIYPNQFTLSSTLRSCSSLDDIRIGKGVHGWIIRNGISLDTVLENSILDVYAKFEIIDYMKKIFESMIKRNIVSYNIMLNAYLKIGDVENSLNFFRELPYKDSASWNTIIDGLVNCGYARKGLELLYQMVENGVEFNKFTFSIALGLVSSLSNVELGRQVHGHIIRFGVQNDGFVRNSLIDMYNKCGNLEKASMIFRKMPLDFVKKVNSTISNCNDNMDDVVSFSSMVSGYVQNGNYEDALNTFLSMVHEQVYIDRYTLTSIVSACSNTGNLVLGRQIHACIQKIGHRLDPHLGSSLIDVYAKCGCLDDSRRIFKQTSYLNVVLWTSMISGCALHGQGREAIRLFEHMTREGVKPNEVAFVGILTACSHTGLIEEGCKYFNMMKEVYKIKPGIEHYICMVDLYGRAGKLNETKDFIFNNNLSHLPSVWKAFLSSCRLYKNIEMGKWVAGKLFEIEEKDSGSYVLLSNMCSSSQRFEEAAKMRNLMQRRGVSKTPGQSWLQLKNQVHSFIVGDRSHPQDGEIYSCLEKLIGKLKEIGYSLDGKMVMQDVEEEQGELLLGYHSEKLAIAFAIISSGSGTPIRVMKNLRVCNDCHEFMKLTSRLLGREIVLRDSHRFHHFNAGHCSCGDYW